MTKKRAGQIVDILMYGLLLAQMMYIFVGNNAHEILGMGFFACLVIHVVIKGWWFKTLFQKKKGLRLAFDITTTLLMLSVLVLMLSSMGVSRFLFPDIVFMGSSSLHRYMATAVLTLGVLHGCLVMIRHSKRKGAVVILTAVLCIASLTLGLFLVPYMNRHLKKITVSSEDMSAPGKISWSGDKPLVVYFSRVGNTDFEPDVDAVSGASLLIRDKELVGNDQYLAEMIGEMLDCDPVAITLTDYHYPSSYNDTISVAGDELRAKVRPAIEPIDVSAYDSIILIYPLWWSSIPMPVATFLEENDLSGKTIYLIATQGSSGFGKTVSEIEELAPGATVIPGTSIYCEDITKSQDEIESLIKKWSGSF